MISVLRLGHRPERDKRATTHVFLVARAFGADRIYYTGIRDRVIEESMAKVCDRWGGKIKIEFIDSWPSFLKKWPSKIIHLTMYGLPIQDTIDKIKQEKDILVVVGGEKVPSEVYQLADYNVSVTNQPHSEIAALAVFLDRFFEGKELKNEFKGAKQFIMPAEKRKIVRKID